MASRWHILIVEDEPSVLEVLQETLEESYRVSSVGTVGDACAFLRTSHVDLVLVDWGLPDGHGDVVAAYAETRNVAAIMMSGHPNGMDGVQNNSRPYLMKPFGLKTLSATVSSALDRGHSDPKVLLATRRLACSFEQIA
jgi:two-component system, OmpR family, catabolic regulation response regulator CreB